MASHLLPSFPLCPPFHSRSNCTHSTMASLKSADPPVLQKFESKYGETLGRLPTQVCPMTGRRYILWSDIQNAFASVVRLSDGGKASLLFMVDKDGELYVPFCRRRNDLDKNTSNLSFAVISPQLYSFAHSVLGSYLYNYFHGSQRTKSIYPTREQQSPTRHSPNTWQTSNPKRAPSAFSTHV